MLGFLEDHKVIRKLSPEHRWGWIIFDRKASTADEVCEFLGSATLIGLDEGGEGRECFTYCIDTLPAPPGISPPNIFAPGFLDLPDKRKNFDLPIKHVLISFGGEDPAGLTGALYTLLVENGLFEPAVITVAAGQHRGKPSYLHPDTSVFSYIGDLKQRLHQWDLVFTSFGLTCFEALSAGVPVLLLNPTQYHKLLSRTCGIPEIGVGRPNIKELQRYLHDPEALTRIERDSAKRLLAGTSETSLPEYIFSLRRPESQRCPACGKKNNRAVARFAERTFLLCSDCSLIYQLQFFSQSVQYDRAYFFDQYKAQYGKTYVEDFTHIKRMGQERVDRILSVLKSCDRRTIEKRIWGQNKKGPWSLQRDGNRAKQDQYSLQRDGNRTKQDRSGLQRNGESRDRELLGSLQRNRTDGPKTTECSPAQEAGIGEDASVRLLDIGCAYGPFLDAAKDAGFSPYGIDVCEDAVRYVNEKLHLPAAVCDVFQFDPVDCFNGVSGFDVVSLWFVIEHLDRLSEILGRINSWLSKGGVICFSTPTYRGISGRRDIRLFLESSPTDHLTVWSPESAASVLKKFGFRVVKTVITGHHPDRFSFVKKMNGPAGLVAGIISRWFGFGDTFEVYAVKEKEVDKE
jgi:2-polyprenyl-3-methyl-5-hydroxy-6-metoxy-1,4-benzoquinol methylase